MTQSKLLEPLVRKILAEQPKTRDSYIELVFAVWEEQGLHLTPEQRSKISGLSNNESISRAARKIWENGEFKASEFVRKKRQQNEIEYRQENKKVTYIGNIAYIE